MIKPDQQENFSEFRIHIHWVVNKAELDIQLQGDLKMNTKQEHPTEMTERLAPVKIISDRSLLTGLPPIRLVCSKSAPPK